MVEILTIKYIIICKNIKGIKRKKSIVSIQEILKKSLCCIVYVVNFTTI